MIGWIEENTSSCGRRTMVMRLRFINAGVSLTARPKPSAIICTSTLIALLRWRGSGW